MSHHDHSHNHGGHGHDHHDHDHSDETVPALQTLIYKEIDFDKVRTLNESELDAGIKVIRKPWAQRMDAEPELTSDADEQLLMFVPYVLVPLCRNPSLIAFNPKVHWVAETPLHSPPQQL